jgi:acyl-CoA thioesterase-1
VRTAGEKRVVRDHHERRAPLTVEFLHQLDDRLAGDAVEVASRLVCEQDLRIIHEGARERDPLLLAAGQLRRIVVQPMAQADTLEQASGALSDIALSAQLQRHLNVLVGGQGGHELKRLKDKADGGAPEACTLVLGQGTEFGAVDRHAAAAWRVEASQQPQQGRLAAAGGAEDRDKVTRLDVEVDVTQHRHRACAAGVRLLKRARREHRILRGAKHVVACWLLAASIIGCAGACGNSIDGTSDNLDHSAHEVLASVVFIGTSLTAGLGLPEAQSYPRLIERRIAAAGLTYRVVNAGVSGDTSAGALRRIDWLLQQNIEVVVLETGANDMLRGVDPSATEQNIQAIIDRIRAANRNALIVLAGMRSLPNMGGEYGRAFEALYPRLARRNDLPLVPFLLEGVAGKRELIQQDGLHPNAQGQALIAETVWRVLEPLLIERAKLRR